MNRLLSGLSGWLRSGGVSATGAREGAQELFWIASDLGLGAEAINQASRAFRKAPLDIAPGNVWSQLGQHTQGWLESERLTEFLQTTACIAPTWLAKSVYARPGKFELFYRLTRSGSGTPVRGDILYRGRVIEVKGKGGTLAHPSLTGMCHHYLSAQALGNWGIVPNRVPGRGEMYSHEIIKRPFKKFYAQQFASDSGRAVSALEDYLESLSIVPRGTGDTVAAEILACPDSWDDELRRVWTSAIYREHRANRNFDQLIVFGDGTNVKVINDESDLKSLRTSARLRSGLPIPISLQID